MPPSRREGRALEIDRFELKRSSVVPAKAGTHLAALCCSTMGPGFRREDDRRRLLRAPPRKAWMPRSSPGHDDSGLLKRRFNFPARVCPKKIDIIPEWI